MNSDEDLCEKDFMFAVHERSKEKMRTMVKNIIKLSKSDMFL